MSELRVAAWNVVTLKTGSAEIFENLLRRKVFICCNQENRWEAGNAAKQISILEGMFGKYRFYYCLNESSPGGAGVLLQESWADKVIEVQRISNRTIIPKLMIGNRVVNFDSVYAPQASLPAVNKLFL